MDCGYEYSSPYRYVLLPLLVVMRTLSLCPPSPLGEEKKEKEKENKKEKKTLADANRGKRRTRNSSALVKKALLSYGIITARSNTNILDGSFLALC